MSRSGSSAPMTARPTAVRRSSQRCRDGRAGVALGDAISVSVVGSSGGGLSSTGIPAGGPRSFSLARVAPRGRQDPAAIRRSTAGRIPPCW